MITLELINRYHLNTLTPVQEYNGILYKRDDLYVPFSDIPLSGGKVRQAISLIAHNSEHIREDCDSHVVTSCGMSSPQGIIIARVARDFDFKSTIFIGNTKPESFKKLNLVMNVLAVGGKLDYSSRLAYDSVLMSAIKKRSDAGEKFFIVKFGINVDNDSFSILETTANQVQNVPKDVTHIIVPAGAGLMMAGILIGVKHFNLNVKVIGIQISGRDVRETINHSLKIAGANDVPYEYLISKDFPYHREVNISVGDGVDSFLLDPIYEAKAHFVMSRKILPKLSSSARPLFWIVGNSRPVRRKVYTLD